VTRRQYAGHQRVLLREHLPGPAERDEGTHVLRDVRIVDGRQRTVDPESEVNDIGKCGGGFQTIGPTVVDRGPGAAQARQFGQHLGQPLAQCGTGGELDVLALYQGPELGHRGVGTGPLVGQGTALVEPVPTEVHQGEPALLLQRREQRLGRLAHAGIQRGDPQQVHPLAQGHERGEAPQRGEGYQQCDDLRAYPAVVSPLGAGSTDPGSDAPGIHDTVPMPITGGILGHRLRERSCRQRSRRGTRAP